MSIGGHFSGRLEFAMTTTAQPVLTTVDYFESIYAEAAGESSCIPWADGHPASALVNWLNAVAPSLIRCGARVAVVGCGLGDDAREIIHRGYDVTAFDCSDTAVHWAQAIDPENADCYVHADLLDLPIKWRHRFDLVVEVNTLQSLAMDIRKEAVAAMADLLAAHGRLLVICRRSEDSCYSQLEPPWPLTESELLNACVQASLELDSPICAFTDDENPPIDRMRAVLKRS